MSGTTLASIVAAMSLIVTVVLSFWVGDHFDKRWLERFAAWQLLSFIFLILGALSEGFWHWRLGNGIGVVLACLCLWIGYYLSKMTWLGVRREEGERVTHSS